MSRGGQARRVIPESHFRARRLSGGGRKSGLTAERAEVLERALQAELEYASKRLAERWNVAVETVHAWRAIVRRRMASRRQH